MNNVLQFKYIYLLLIPELYLITSFLMLLSFGLFHLSKQNQLDIFKPMMILFNLILLGEAVLMYINTPFLDYNLYYIHYSCDEKTQFFKCILTFIFFVSNCVFLSYYKAEKLLSIELPILLFILYGAIYIVISLNDLFLIFLFLELQALIFYGLIKHKKFSNIAIESSTKYFILSAVSSSFFIFATTYFYRFFLTTDLLELKTIEYFPLNNSYYNLGVVFASMLLLIGLTFKLSLFPFHFWAPDVYQGAPTPIVLLLSTASKLPLFYIFIKIYFIVLLNYNYYWCNLIFFSALITLIVGVFGALFQSNIRRFIAYSTLVHMGFIFLNFSTTFVESAISGILYFIVYALITLNLFAIITILRRKINNLEFVKIKDFLLIYKINPALTISFTLVLFSLVGVPPLSGFFAKFVIFGALINSLNIFLVILIILINVIGSVYYLNILKEMFFKNYKKWIFLKNISLPEAIVISFLTYLNLFYIIFHPFFIYYLNNIFLN